jgi:hypothetical protein
MLFKNIMLFASLILALLPGVEAQQGICPNYYGPFEPDPMGNESCQNMMPAGAFNILWAHGLENDRDWQDWNQVEMKPNMRYVLTYNATRDLSIDEYADSSLNGNTKICCKNEGPDAIVFCLRPSQEGPEQGGPGQEGPDSGRDRGQ